MGKQKGTQAAQASRSFGQNLARFRERAGLSQQGTADRAGLHRTHVATIEAGQRLPRLDTVVKRLDLLKAGLSVGTVLAMRHSFSLGKRVPQSTG